MISLVGTGGWRGLTDTVVFAVSSGADFGAFAASDLGGLDPPVLIGLGPCWSLENLCFKHRGKPPGRDLKTSPFPFGVVAPTGFKGPVSL